MDLEFNLDLGYRTIFININHIFLHPWPWALSQIGLFKENLMWFFDLNGLDDIKGL